ncbi:hypothetical protein MtrunA17_Chr8g0344301 [Medicago truncatula]|uniref:Uncharacterized protein n=1 Tax=Medicago truncatula TaxID=3880 RepID=A0A396GLF2_MEDTR|nr:hypothetical protein MtrunA17_Chr8g0344301 [Medicago truncatula]
MVAYSNDKYCTITHLLELQAGGPLQNNAAGVAIRIYLQCLQKKLQQNVHEIYNP